MNWITNKKDIKRLFIKMRKKRERREFVLWVDWCWWCPFWAVDDQCWIAVDTVDGCDWSGWCPVHRSWITGGEISVVKPDFLGVCLTDVLSINHCFLEEFIVEQVGFRTKTRSSVSIPYNCAMVKRYWSASNTPVALLAFMLLIFFLLHLLIFYSGDRLIIPNLP